MRIRSRPRIVSDKECQRAEDFMGWSADLRLEPGLSSRELHWTAHARRVAASAPRARARVPVELRRSERPFLAKSRRLLMGNLLLSR